MDEFETKRHEASEQNRFSEDLVAIFCAGALLFISLGSTWLGPGDIVDQSWTPTNPISGMVGKPAEWEASPIDAFGQLEDSGQRRFDLTFKLAGSCLLLSMILGLGVFVAQGFEETKRFLVSFIGVFSLATIAYVFAANLVAKAYNLEYALWALGIGLLISNLIGTPKWLLPAVKTEFFIKTGLILLGAEVLMSRLMALGIPGVCVAWVVTPIVLVSTYWFGQRVLKLESRSLNMVISADMSVCGVSAAIASAAACKAKKEELSLAIGMSLSFTVVMMVVLPVLIKAIGLNEHVGGAWLGGTIDSTGAVAAAGAVLGDKALEVAATVKMIQNILIGVAAFGIATYWVTAVEPNLGSGEGSQRPGISEIWSRFPKFILGFLAASIIFSILHASSEQGPALVNEVVKGSTKIFRGWLFCLAFVSIGLETRFRELVHQVKGGKPVLLYLCGQSLNLVLTLVMAYLMFGVVFKSALE